jgi:hypothetical protein
MKTKKQINRKLNKIHKQMDSICGQLNVPINQLVYDRLLLQSITLNWVLSKNK